MSEMQGWYERNETDLPQEEKVGLPGLRSGKDATHENEVQGTKCEGRRMKFEEQSTMCKIPGARDFTLRTLQLVLCTLR